MSSTQKLQNSLKKISDSLNSTQQSVYEELKSALIARQAKIQAKQNILAALGLGVGAGTTLAGMKALARLNREQLSEKEIPTGGRVQVELFAPPKKRNLRKHPDPASASYAPPPMIIPFPGTSTGAHKVAGDGVLDEISRIASQPGSWISDISNSVFGDNPSATQPKHFSWYSPQFAAALVGGGALSYTALDSVMKRAKQKAMKQQLANAEREYEAALRSDFDKTSSDRPELAKQFDRIVAALEKVDFSKISNDSTAAASDSAKQIAGLLAGLYMTGMLASGVAGLRGGYASRKKEWKSNALRRAQLQRLQTPDRPQSIDINATPVMPDEEASIM